MKSLAQESTRRKWRLEMKPEQKQNSETQSQKVTSECGQRDKRRDKRRDSGQGARSYRQEAAAAQDTDLSNCYREGGGFRCVVSSTRHIYSRSLGLTWQRHQGSLQILR